jgi:hypothetical protein
MLSIFLFMVAVAASPAPTFNPEWGHKWETWLYCQTVNVNAGSPKVVCPPNPPASTFPTPPPHPSPSP